MAKGEEGESLPGWNRKQVHQVPRRRDIPGDWRRVVFLPRAVPKMPYLTRIKLSAAAAQGSQRRLQMPAHAHHSSVPTSGWSKGNSLPPPGKLGNIAWQGVGKKSPYTWESVQDYGA